MGKRPLRESLWRRGWNDTKTIWTSWPFYILDAVVAAVIGGVFEWYWGLCIIIFGMFCVWLVTTVSAPVKQRNEARKRVIRLEEERIPHIELQPTTGKKASYEQGNKTAWAELKVTNTSSSVPLEDVSVQIVELVQIYEKQNEQGVGTGIYHLHEIYPNWNPSNVFWSERNTLANQLSILIPPGDTKYAMIAFHLESGPDLGLFNTPTNRHILESKIVIEVSSPNSAIRRGAYYIEYHPPSKDEFEFVEWDSWCENHKVIDQLTPDKENSPTE